MASITLHAGDNRDSLRRLIDQGVRVHAVVCDPPYGLVSIQRRFGKEGSKPARTEKNDGSFARLSGGFMGKKWDATGIERDPEFWRLIYEILLPGGYVFAFSGSRTGHWQAAAMEVAGFVMHPMHGWCFGSGFPKAHAADKAIDKMMGTPGSVVAAGKPVRRMIPGADQHRTGSWIKDDDRDYQPGTYLPGSDEAAQWEGWAYGTQAQKPALEPIYLGQKPFSEHSGAANLLRHGVGAVNIAGCRVPITPGADERQLRTMNRGERGDDGWGMGATADATVLRQEGRHPSNLILDGSAEVLAMFPSTKSGTGTVKRQSAADRDGNKGAAYGAESRAAGTPMVAYGDEGSAARFFHQFRRYACEKCQDTGEIYTPMAFVGDSPSLEPCECGGPLVIPPLFYQAKAGKSDRAGSNHPTVKPIALLRYLIRHITPLGGVVLDPFAGSGTTAEAARQEGFDCVLMEADPDYVAFLRRRFGLPAPIDHDFDDIFGAAADDHNFDDVLGPDQSRGDEHDFDDVLG